MALNGAINVSVCCLYREPSYSSEVVSQGILAEQVEVIEHAELFSRIRQDDGYESWASTDQLSLVSEPEHQEVKHLVRSHFARIYSEPSTRTYSVRDAVIGCSLPVTDEYNDWYKIALPDGAVGWVEKRHFDVIQEFCADNIISMAREFLGYQYIWGGRSPKGFDCSGFVQTVFRLHGLLLPRDSHQQQLHNRISDNYQEAQPADLVFFGKTPERVTHVGIALGDERFIHASGWVRCNSFNRADEDYSQRHVDTFVSVNRYQL